MRVHPDKMWIKMCLIPLKLQLYVLLPRKSPPKSTLGKISPVNFCKLIQITKKVDTFRQGFLS